MKVSHSRGTAGRQVLGAKSQEPWLSGQEVFKAVVFRSMSSKLSHVCVIHPSVISIHAINWEKCSYYRRFRWFGISTCCIIDC